MRVRSSTALLLAVGLSCLSAAGAHGGSGRPGLCATEASDRASPPYLAVISAYPAELAPIAAATAIEGSVQIGTRSYYVGRLGGVSVLLGLTGIGVANATDAARSLLARRDIAGVIMSGTGGTRFHIGDVVLASEMVEADREGTFHPNPGLVALARRAVAVLPEPLASCTLVPPGAPDAQTVCLLFAPVVIFGGQLVSVDPFGGMAFACAPGGGEIFGCELPPTASAAPGVGFPAHPLTITTVDLEDMESAAVARIATRRRVPFLAVRSASDGGGDPRGDRGFPAQFFDYYRIATHNAATVTRAVVAELGRLARDSSARRTCRLLARHRWSRAAKQIAPDGGCIQRSGGGQCGGF
jgi:nucleoside phosphorylase